MDKTERRTHPKTIVIHVEPHVHWLYKMNREAGMTPDYIRRKLEQALFHWGKQGGARI